MPIARFWVGRIMLFGHGPKQQARVEGTARHVQSHKVVPHCLLGIFLEERAGSPPNAALDTKHHNASSFEAPPFVSTYHHRHSPGQGQLSSFTCRKNFVISML